MKQKYDLLDPMKRSIQRLLAKYDIALTRKSNIDKLLVDSRAGRDLALLYDLPESAWVPFLRALPQSKAQLRQDLFALSRADFKHDGFFVEFGATNGIDWSNTFLLEKSFRWNGILAEPARTWHHSLKTNRSARIDTDCVWRETGARLQFREVGFSAELSGITSYNPDDSFHAERARTGLTYEVSTVSLVDLLRRHDAPREIDYLSIDTEGSEFDILSAFDFDAYRFGVITCEHNFGADRERIHHLLSQHGYQRVLSQHSQFDDWYERADDGARA